MNVCACGSAPGTYLSSESMRHTQLSGHIISQVGGQLGCTFFSDSGVIIHHSCVRDVKRPSEVRIWVGEPQGVTVV